MIATWENVRSEAARGANPERPLTHLLDLGERGLAVKATRTCSIDGCEKPHYGRGWCRSHYASYWRASRSALCSIEGCDGRQHARGWCITHYSRWRTTGEPGSADLLRQRGERCAVADCDRPYEGVGYCKLHRERWKRHGDPLHVDVARWGGDDIGYSGMHDRLRRNRGAASTHPCQQCGRPARDWAYTHDCPNERLSEEGPYSTDQTRYVPLCGSCHQRADKARVKAKRGESNASRK